MKNQYIVIHEYNGEHLYFSNNVTPLFSSVRAHAEIYTNKKTATHYVKYSRLFATHENARIYIEKL